MFKGASDCPSESVGKNDPQFRMHVWRGGGGCSVLRPELLLAVVHLYLTEERLKWQLCGPLRQPVSTPACNNVLNDKSFSRTLKYAHYFHIGPNGIKLYSPPPLLVYNADP